MSNNFWLGNNELIIVERKGAYHVLESYENYESVFVGTYKECLEYCKNLEIAYMEEVV